MPKPKRWMVGRVERCWQFAIMIKTHVQISDQLYDEAKRLAHENAMSFAELCIGGSRRSCRTIRQPG